jgi:hypothetical protein
VFVLQEVHSSLKFEHWPPSLDILYCTPIEFKSSAITAVSGSSTRLHVEAADVSTSWLESSMLQKDYVL